MLKRRYLVPLPAILAAAMMALFIVGVLAAEVSAQAPCPQCKQQTPCCPYRCCECCTPNFRYWGYWPTTWRQWPQRRPDIWFPQGVGIEQIQAPQGAVPEKLPKEEPFVSPTAPGESWLPPVGEGSATGPGEPDAPFDFDQGLEQGPGFDQSLPGMEDLPTEQLDPSTLPIEGIEDSNNAAPMPESSDSNGYQNDSVLTQQQLDSTETPAAEESPVFEDEGETETGRLSPLANVDSGANSDVVYDELEYGEPEYGEPLAPVAPHPGDTCLKSVSAVAQEPSAVNEQLVPYETEPQESFGEYEEREDEAALPPEPKEDLGPLATDAELPPMPEAHGAIRQTTFESPAEQLPAVGLDGYCPVALVHDEVWTPGDPRYTAEFEGHTYTMSGPLQHRAFRSNPERYAPANSGFDPVLSFEENRRCLGKTNACAVFEGRLYMFANAESLARFQSNPMRYIQPLKQQRK